MILENLLKDLEFWLVSITLLCGTIWLLYALFSKKNSEEPIIVEYAKAFFPVLLLVVFLRSFVAEPFRIPSGSMIPTLEVGDFILVNKFAYGIRIPVIRTKIIDTGLPKRGDVFVFRYPERPWQNFIKRVIGLPGDRLKWQGDQLFINGKKVINTFSRKYKAVNQQGRISNANLHVETLGDIQHDIIFLQEGPRNTHSTGETVVPEGYYFAVGDNRFGSHDSRAWGFVPEKNLVGKALFVWMHYSGNDKGIDFSRIGTPIK